VGKDDLSQYKLDFEPLEESRMERFKSSWLARRIRRSRNTNHRTSNVHLSKRLLRAGGRRKHITDGDS
jgi:hypothetical protein